MATGTGLRQMRSEGGPVNPNKFWGGRTPRKRCSCGRKIRGTNHENGQHHKQGPKGVKE